MARHDSAYDDDPTEEEIQQMEEDERKRGVPDPDDSSEGPPPADDGEGEDDGGEKRDPPADDQPPPQQEGGDGHEEEEEPGQNKLAAFLEKHKGKSAEELVQLAFQQEQRAKRAEFDHRKTSENLGNVLARIQQARDARVNSLAEQREAFKKKVEADPDAALLEAHEARLKSEQDRELAALDAQEFEARATAAIELASAAIPDFAARAPQIRQFGIEMGYSPDEIGQIVDGRHIVTLHLASIAGNMIKAGIMDTTGRFIGLPDPVADPPAGGQGQQPGRRGTGFGKQPARGAQSQKTLDQRLADISNMSDADFDKLDPKELDALLREVEQQQ